MRVTFVSKANVRIEPASRGSSTPSKEQEVTQTDALHSSSASSPKTTCASSAAFLLFRVLRAILCAYVILLVGALLLYWAESQNEINHACASRAEENLARVSMRLPPKLDDVCM